MDIQTTPNSTDPAVKKIATRGHHRQQELGRSSHTYHGTDLPFSHSVWALRQQLIARPLTSTQFGLALLKAPVARRNEYSHSSPEDVAEPRRRQNRTTTSAAPTGRV
ncbi:hypothetical protein E8E14_008460 [Neopestalotiopsis sp. 37M]|nr:hypothetical protein E8E14_008460 [Neopestalotiopsis sp. 37M]